MTALDLVLEGDAAGLEHAEAGLHVEDDAGAGDHPQRVVMVPALQQVRLYRAGVVPELDPDELGVWHGELLLLTVINWSLR